MATEPEPVFSLAVPVTLSMSRSPEPLTRSAVSKLPAARMSADSALAWRVLPAGQVISDADLWSAAEQSSAAARDVDEHHAVAVVDAGAGDGVLPGGVQRGELDGRVGGVLGGDGHVTAAGADDDGDRAAGLEGVHGAVLSRSVAGCRGLVS